MSFVAADATLTWAAVVKQNALDAGTGCLFLVVPKELRDGESNPGLLRDRQGY